MISGVPLFLVDAFTDKVFQGNPAAVCLLDSFDGVDDQWMQNVAIEMNLSETAFFDRSSNRLRWFTPAFEVDLCGHATVGTVKALLETGFAKPGESLTFDSRSGPLSAEIDEAGKVRLDFPATPAAPIDSSAMLQSLFPAGTFFGKSRFDLLVEFETHQAVKEFQPDFNELLSLDFRGIIITAKSDQSEFDFVSRFFAPAFGVNEDPVTGSAHCCLAPYWSQKLGMNEMSAAQISKRGGRIDLKVVGDRVQLIGDAVLVMKGTLFPNAHT